MEMRADSGYKLIASGLITLKGVKPLGITQWKRDNFYLYGVVEPLRGESYILEFTHLDTICFELYLEKFAAQYPEEIHIIQVDNGAFHVSNNLTVPAKVILLCQPTHTPEVNPIERLWEEIKKPLTWECFPNLDELRQALGKELEKLTKSQVKSLVSRDFIWEAALVSGFL